MLPAHAYLRPLVPRTHLCGPWPHPHPTSPAPQVAHADGHHVRACTHAVPVLRKRWWGRLRHLRQLHPERVGWGDNGGHHSGGLAVRHRATTPLDLDHMGLQQGTPLRGPGCRAPGDRVTASFAECKHYGTCTVGQGRACVNAVSSAAHSCSCICIYTYSPRDRAAGGEADGPVCASYAGAARGRTHECLAASFPFCCTWG